MPIIVQAGTAQVEVDQSDMAGIGFVPYAVGPDEIVVLTTRSTNQGTPPKGDHRKAIRYSYALLAMPWEMESQRTHWFRWLEFSVFHLCMAVAIGVAFTMPWGHGFMAAPAVVYALQAIFGLATLIGLSRFLRRVASPVMRKISTPDDYFCVSLLSTWAASGVLMVPQTSELWLVVYFGLATFLIEVLVR